MVLQLLRALRQNTGGDPQARLDGHPGVVRNPGRDGTSSTRCSELSSLSHESATSPSSPNPVEASRDCEH